MMHKEILKSDLKITQWKLRKQPAVKYGISQNETRESTSQKTTWEQLENSALHCKNCALHLTRQHVVFGSGNRTAEWLFVGEAPGAEEDKQGKPFVGRAGKLLTSMMYAMNMDREKTYIANILKCRPPNNRDPDKTEIGACMHYLNQQIALIQPKIIVALGSFAAQNLLRTNTAISKIRGVQHVLPGDTIPVVVTYHPAYLLRSPTKKKEVWKDLVYAKTIFTKQKSR